MPELRNIAIIAHVDHGKTTLVDQLLRQSGSFRENQRVAERVMDSNDLERERGITILAKCASVDWNDIRINIVDAPGHADFGGEVERILSMVDGALVLVDSAEGPMPQTKFVTMKALALGLKPIVVINKADRPDQRSYQVHEEVLTCLRPSMPQMNSLIFLRCMRRRKRAGPHRIWNLRGSRCRLFRAIAEHFAPPVAERDAPFAMLSTILEYDNYLGRILTGRIERGTARVNSPVVAQRHDGTQIEAGRLTKLLAFRGIERVPVDEAHAGDLIAIAGLKEATVADTIGDPEIPSLCRRFPSIRRHCR